MLRESAGLGIAANPGDLNIATWSVAHPPLSTCIGGSMVQMFAFEGTDHPNSKQVCHGICRIQVHCTLSGLSLWLNATKGSGALGSSQDNSNICLRISPSHPSAKAVSIKNNRKSLACSPRKDNLLALFLKRGICYFTFWI